MASDLKIVCWKWKPVAGYRSEYGPKQVNHFFNMVERHYTDPHEVVCITDDAEGIDPRVRIVPLWDTFRHIPSPHGGLNPACYHRLPMYAESARDIIGERFVSVDLDCVIVDDMRPVWNRKEDFIIWGETLRTTPYNGSMQMMTAGARKQVFEEFDPVESPRATVKAGYHGSDQAWISYKLGPHEARWSRKDGIFSYRMDVRKNGGTMPKGARLIFFEGHIDPWSQSALQTAPWIRDHWK